jgi:hypothetical protein
MFIKLGIQFYAYLEWEYESQQIIGAFQVQVIFY